MATRGPCCRTRAQSLVTRRSCAGHAPTGCDGGGCGIERLDRIAGRCLVAGHEALALLARQHLVDMVEDAAAALVHRSEEHTSELQSPCNLVCRLLLEKKKYYVLSHKKLVYYAILATKLFLQNYYTRSHYIL